MQYRVMLIVQGDHVEQPDRNELWAALRDEVFKLNIELEDGTDYTVTMMTEVD